MPEVHSHLLAFIIYSPSFDAYSWPREAPTGDFKTVVCRQAQ